ncbi:hypothetical protein BGZ72_000599, partial [Mortierella alpina]
MGVSEAFQFLKGKYEPEEVRQEHLSDMVHVDFHSLFVGYCANTLSSMKAASWKKPTSKQQPPQAIFENFARAL